MEEKEQEINRAIFLALAASLNMNPASPEASKTILRSWGTRQPPQSPRADNLIFYDFSPDPDARMYTERTIVNNISGIYRFIPCRLSLIFYGASSAIHAFRVRDNLFLDGTDKPRGILRKAGIYPTPTIRALSTFHEEENGFYRKRADLVISAYLLSNCDETESGALQVPTITNPPELILHAKEA